MNTDPPPCSANAPPTTSAATPPSTTSYRHRATARPAPSTPASRTDSGDRSRITHRATPPAFGVRMGPPGPTSAARPRSTRAEMPDPRSSANRGGEAGERVGEGVGESTLERSEAPRTRPRTGLAEVPQLGAETRGCEV